MDTLIGGGFYTAKYFMRSKEILAGRNTPVKMQVFQKGWGVLHGMEEAVCLIKDHAPNAIVCALADGTMIAPWETVMTIEGNLGEFIHLESVYLGILARGTRVATNMREIVDAANGKPVIFMGDRFDRYENQESDGQAALAGGAMSVCTPAMGHRNNVPAQGTMPHALIAAFGGDVAEACVAYAETFPGEPITALVDFNNDCVGDSLKVLARLGSRLTSVRLDTSEKLIDKSLQRFIPQLADPDDRELNGVNRSLVAAVRSALDDNNGKHVNIIVSGGFTPQKIRLFENSGAAVDVYGVGSSVLKNGADFTADVVLPVGKVGRPEMRNEWLVQR